MLAGKVAGDIVFMDRGQYKVYDPLMAKSGHSSQSCFVELPVVGRRTIDCSTGCRGLAALLLVSTATLPWLYFSLDGHGLLL